MIFIGVMVAGLVLAAAVVVVSVKRHPDVVEPRACAREEEVDEEWPWPERQAA